MVRVKTRRLIGGTFFHDQDVRYAVVQSVQDAPALAVLALGLCVLALSRAGGHRA